MNILPFRTPVFSVRIPIPNTVITLRTPSKADYYGMLMCSDKLTAAELIIKKYSDVHVPMTNVSAAVLISEYTEALQKYRTDNMDVMCVPKKEDYGAGTQNRFPVITGDESVVYEHCGLTIAQQNELPVTEYWVLLADAVKMRAMKTKAGTEYLEECYNDMHRINTLFF